MKDWFQGRYFCNYNTHETFLTQITGKVGVQYCLICDLRRKKHITIICLNLRLMLIGLSSKKWRIFHLYALFSEWEGGDEWIQAQFRAYLQSLLVTMEKNGELSFTVLGFIYAL